MKHIVKGPEPDEFTQWKALANSHWQPTYDNMDTPVKRAVKQALMHEQGDLCCYCERRVTENDSHIEHFQPQSDPAVDPLDFSNMLCSCQKDLKRGDPRHCGNLKGDWYDATLLISPMDPACAGRFVYTADGNIAAVAGDVAARETIDRLGLDLPKLNAMREAAIEPFLDDMSDDELREFVTAYLDTTGTQLNEFYTTIEFLFGTYAA